MASSGNEITGGVSEESNGSESRVSASRRMLLVEVSRSVSVSASRDSQAQISSAISQKINWVSRLKMFKCWIRNPLNMVLFIWISAVAISLAILLLVISGLLNRTITEKSERDEWIEVNNQILNALLTLMCLYQHPKRFHHFVLLCRWKPDDVSKLRSIYCKNGTSKPHERTHMMVVVTLLHINCFAQYGLCILNLGYKRSERPEAGVVLCIFVAIAAAAFAGIYAMLSPLGKERKPQLDEENQDQGTQNPVHLRMRSLETKYTFVSTDNAKITVNNPRWNGGILDLQGDFATAYRSIFCLFCVFGWNMERLGFGNMYVHISTFILFCTAPFMIFSLAAMNIDNETAREVLGFSGIVLSASGLLYGAFWRIKMRKRFNLPGYNFCCQNPAMSDCVLWLFCCWCSLAQEVRTADLYDVVEDVVEDNRCEKQLDSSGRLLLSSLPSENVAFDVKSVSVSTTKSSDPNPPKIISTAASPPKGFQIKIHEGDECVLADKEDSDTRLDGNVALTPPSPSFIQREGA